MGAQHVYYTICVLGELSLADLLPLVGLRLQDCCLRLLVLTRIGV